MANGGSNPYNLSDQDAQDLQQIQSQLQPSDPRYGKVTALLATYPSSQTKMANQALAASGIPGGAAPPAAPPPMQESLAPKIVRGVAPWLPVIGAVGGGIAGAPAGGVGSVAGATVGGMTGKQAQQSIERSLAVNLPGNKYEEQPISDQEVAKDVLKAGAISGASELGGGLAIGAGRKVIGNIALRRVAGETGDVAKAIEQAAPTTISGKGLKFSLSDAMDNISSKLSGVLKGSQQTTSLAQTIAPIRTQAAQSTVTGVAKTLDRSIEAAKELAGITGDQATADQMFSFAQALVKPNKFSAQPAAVQQLLNEYAQGIYRQAGAAVRSLVPEADPLLQQMTNLHAAKSAVKAYGPGTTAASLVTAATHPRTTAAVSPFATAGAAYLDPKEIVRQLKAGVGAVLP